MAPEFLRLKGNLLYVSSPDNAGEAELCYQQALQAAQNLQANMMELRVALSLFRLWREQGKGEQGDQLLRGILEKFTEGFTTADLMEARELLSNMQG